MRVMEDVNVMRCLAYVLITTLWLSESTTIAFPINSNLQYSNSLRHVIPLVRLNLKNPFKKETSDIVKEKTAEDIVDLNSSTEAKTFYVPRSQAGNILASSFQALTRLGSGVFAEGYKISLEQYNDSSYFVARFGNYQINESCSPNIANLARSKPIEIYEFEGCPFCRKVREAVSILCLRVLFKPCPKDGQLFRKEIKDMYGSDATFPYMIDPNTGTKMFESDEIITYLFSMYGDGVVPSQLLGPAAPITAGIGLLPRLGRGSKVKPSNPPQEPLILWAYEGSPFCKIVREELCELEIPHLQISTPRGSSSRQKMFDVIGKFQVPYLEDPNEGISLFESEAIIEYIQKRYGITKSPIEYL